MAIHTLRYEHNGQTCWGVITGKVITPIHGRFDSTADFVRSVTPASLKDLRMETLPLHSVRILSPITRDREFICQGANYRQHMIESGLNPDDINFNMIFSKSSSSIVPADSPVERPDRVKLLDYEIELGVVIKRDITEPVQVTDACLHEFIAGIVIVNDYSARDIQIPEMQWYKGKSFRTFGPVGPYLCLLEERDMPMLKNLDLHLTVNGQTRQKDNTRNLVNGMAATLTELSSVHDLFAGDLLSTGTPAGCALSVPSPAQQRIAALLPEKTKWKLFRQAQSQQKEYLQLGDVVEAVIRSPDGRIDLGRQRNEIVQAKI